MKNRKKVIRIAVCLLVAAGICLVPVIADTFAYLSNKGPAKGNKFTVGNVTIDIVEEFNPPSSLVVGDNIYKKQVLVKNTGTVDAYGRVAVAFSNNDIEDISYLSSDGGKTWYAASDFKNHLPSNWAYASDGVLGGYYYYTKALAPGQSSTPLFTHVKTRFQEKKADTDISINYTPRDYDIYVYAEGLQQMRLDGSKKHTSYADAWTAFLNMKK